MPKEFAQYATTRIILDCAELFIQQPSAMLAQSETWSDYKHHNVMYWTAKHAGRNLPCALESGGHVVGRIKHVELNLEA